MIFARSLNVIFKTLERDILNIKLPGLHAKDICRPSPNPLAAAEYACVYWMDHLEDSQHNGVHELSSVEKGRLDAFLQQKLLHWLEALSILGSVSDGIQVLQKLETLIGENEESEMLLNRARDASRFIRYHRTAIESSPLQDQRPDWVLNNPVKAEKWSPCFQTLEGHSDGVTYIAWSPNGSRLASASGDKTVRVWNPVTGQSISTFEGYSNWVNSIAWSPDGSRLASASNDKTVRIWDPATSQSTSTLDGHSGSVWSIAWSPDGNQLALASSDGTARLWDPATSQSILALDGHGGEIISITWSPDGSRLASASIDNTVRIWNLATGQSVSNLHIGFIGSLQFEKDDLNLLHTNIGIGSKGPMTPVSDDFNLPLKQYGYGLSQEHSWITYNGLNLLWLPPDSRPSRSHHFAKHTNALAICCSSGHLIFLTFSQQNPISSL